MIEKCQKSKCRFYSRIDSQSVIAQIATTAVVPNFKSIGKVMRDLRFEFPNFESAIYSLEDGIALASVLKPAEFRVDPILLDGAPGIGKTMFASGLAEKLGVPFLKISAAGLQNGAQICGTASHWSNSHQGQIFELLAANESAVAVILVDEIDKISGSSSVEYGVLPALLELMEAGSARTFKDQATRVYGRQQFIDGADIPPLAR